MQKWEYFRIWAYFQGNIQPKWYFDYNGKRLEAKDWMPVMNELGNEGWELVCSLPVNPAQVELYFKRPKQ